MRKEVHAPGKLAHERLGISVGRNAHRRGPHMSGDDAAAQIVVADEAYPIAVGSGSSVLDQPNIFALIVGNTPTVSVGRGQSRRARRAASATG